MAYVKTYLTYSVKLFLLMKPTKFYKQNRISKTLTYSVSDCFLFCGLLVGPHRRRQYVSRCFFYDSLCKQKLIAMKRLLLLLGIAICNISYCQSDHDYLKQITTQYTDHYNHIKEWSSNNHGVITKSLDSRWSILTIPVYITGNDTLYFHVKFWFVLGDSNYKECKLIPDRKKDDLNFYGWLARDNMNNKCTVDKSYRLCDFGDIIVIHSTEANNDGIYTYSIFTK
jgi:hypothetical protein